MIIRVFKFLKDPINIPKKIYIKICDFLNLIQYNKKNFIDNQNKIFLSYNLDRNLGLEKLYKMKRKYNFENHLMSSEHETFFSSLSISSTMKIQKILEIGTFDGKNSFLLSTLFQNAKIDTIDLESHKDDFKMIYGRDKELEKFLINRNQYLKKDSKINFIEMNSIKLGKFKNKYDLIWIDGAHGYPFVCIDIINSIRLINNDGIIMCDDVYMNKVYSDKIYKSYAAYEVLTELKKENIIDFKLIYKRLDKKNNSSNVNRKYIAIIKVV